MGIADDIKILSEDIIASYNLRVKTIGELKKDTHDMLKGFQSEHKKMATDLRKNLEQGETDRLKDFNSMMGDIKKFVVDMIEETGSLMNQFRTEQKNRSAEQKNRSKAVAELLEKFAKDHKAMADELKKTLAEGEAVRLEDFKTLMDGIQKYVDDVVKETKRLIGEIQARQDERNKEVLDLLQEFKTEREKMAANWQSLTAEMAKKRGIKPKVEAEVKVRPVEEAIEELKEDKVSPDEIELEEKVLEFIERHPEGVKVGDMEEPLGATRMRLGKIAKTILNKGKVRKEENMYFPL
ncbi:MAG: hypothetical protein M1479_06295 [Actinobacteria bacterium]|nr:hypothetical protein [Actinomycetota bacterium]